MSNVEGRLEGGSSVLLVGIGGFEGFAANAEDGIDGAGREFLIGGRDNGSAGDGKDGDDTGRKLHVGLLESS